MRRLPFRLTLPILLVLATASFAPIQGLAAKGSPAASAADAATPEAEEIRVLLELSGTRNLIDKMAQHVALDIRDLKQLDANSRRIMSAAIIRHFGTDELLNQLTEEILASLYDANHARRARNFYETPMASQIRASEQRALANKTAMKKYLAAVKQFPPSEQRQQLGERFTRATRLEENAMQISMAASEAAVRGVRALLHGERPEPLTTDLDGDGLSESESLDHVNAYLDATHNSLERAIPKREEFRVWYMHGRTMLPQLEQVVGFVESPSGQWLFKAVYLALDGVLMDATQEFLEDLASKHRRVVR